MIDFATNQWS